MTSKVNEITAAYKNTMSKLSSRYAIYLEFSHGVALGSHCLRCSELNTVEECGSATME